ncbi:MAG: flavodoxin family protein [Candidatus Methanomethylophilaceae archaeon]|nr:flavodoxin family protein [Candidatus Methanomethylophilaceae archaeon]
MTIAVFNGSPRKNGNTSQLVDEFVRALSSEGGGAEVMTLFDKDIKGCMNCGVCQKKAVPGHCTIKDDMSAAFDLFLSSDTIVLASPIYMWQFTPCTLAFMNRLHCLVRGDSNEMAGKKLAFLITMGDELEVSEYSVGGLKDFCEYFGMEYVGGVAVPYATKEEIASGICAEDISDLIEQIV